jgi:hypothetical protein
MDQIYKYVSFDTMIWLGLPADESNLALELVANTHNDESFFDRLLETDGQSRGASRIPPAGRLGKPVIDPRDPTPWKALRALLCREWWTRTWIIQEAILSNMHCRIVCGSASTTLYEFTQFHEKFMSRQSKHHLMPAYVRHVFRGISFIEFVSRFNTLTLGFRQQLLKERGIGSGQVYPGLNLLPLMSFANTAGCTMPRDRIYALFGLCDKRYSQNIKVDYSAPDRDVLLQAFPYLIQTNGLTAIQLGKLRKTANFGLPSWLPDLGTEFSAGQWFVDFSSERWFPPFGHDRTRQPWCADGRGPKDQRDRPEWQKNEPGTSSPIRFSGDYQTLVCRGIPFDTIDVATPISLFSKQEIEGAVEGMQDLVLDSADTHLHHLEQVAASYAAKPYFDSKRAFWYTLYADRDEAGRRLSLAGTVNEPDLDVLRENSKRPQPQIQRLTLLLNERTFVITKSGYFGLGPPDARHGDLICVLQTAGVPFVLRRTSGKEFRFVGDSYVYGISDGEIFGWVKDGSKVIEEFCIR